MKLILASMRLTRSFVDREAQRRNAPARGTMKIDATSGGVRFTGSLVGGRGRGGRGAVVASWASGAGSVALFFAGCSSGTSGGGAGDGPCGAPPGDWQYISSCDSVFGGIVHQCHDDYATPAAAASLKAELPVVCTAGGGTPLSSPCSSANSVGSCVDTSFTGGVSGALERLYEYGDNGADPQSVQQSLRSSCAELHGTFVLPNGPLPEGGATGTVTGCGASGMGGSSTGGVAFSIATVLNGNVVECTNFIGTITSQQLASVEQIGAMTAPCPAAKAACACTRAAGSGTFGTTPTLVYYTTSLDPSASICADAGAGCTTTYAPP